MSATWAVIQTREDGRLGFNWSYVHNDSHRAALLKQFHDLVPYQHREWSTAAGVWLVDRTRLPELKDFALTFDSATMEGGDSITDLRTGQVTTQPKLF